MVRRFYSIGISGQASILDVTMFICISVIALSYLGLESVKTSSSTIFVEESENLNERAIQALDALVQSSGEWVQIYTIQPQSMVPMEGELVDSIKQIMRYTEEAIRVVDEMEHFSYDGTDELSGYLNSLGSLVGELEELIDSGGMSPETGCDAMAQLNKFFPFYSSDLRICHNSIGTRSLNTLLGEMSEVQQELERGLEGSIEEMGCMLAKMRDLASEFLSYLEVGINRDSSFFDLFPVKASVDGLTLEEVTSHSLIVKSNLASTGDVRFLATAAGLLALRGEEMSIDLPGILQLGNISLGPVYVEDERVRLEPRPPLYSVDNNTAQAPYHELQFAVETYLTPSRYLAVSLNVWGPGIGGVKHKTEYFQKIDYILDGPGYGGSHYRTYNGSFVYGRVVEGEVGVSMSGNITTLTRPMTAYVNFRYENETWDGAEYGFEVMHTRTTEKMNLTITREESDGEYDAVAVLLGILFTGRDDLMEKAKLEIRHRLDGILGDEGYKYKFTAYDCCDEGIEINGESKPSGRMGVAKSYFYISGENRGEMTLTVWRE
jgi:hypothetical protein